MVVTVASSLAKTLPTAPPSDLVLRVRSAARQGEVVRLPVGKCTIGAAADCTLRLRAAGVDPLHCTVVQSDHGAMIRCISQNTLINGNAFEISPIRAGDLLAIGPIEFEVVGIGHRVPSAWTSPLTDSDDALIGASADSPELPVTATQADEPEAAPQYPPADIPVGDKTLSAAAPTADDFPFPLEQLGQLPPPENLSSDQLPQAWSDASVQPPNHPHAVASEMAAQAERLREETERLSAARSALERESDRLCQIASDQRNGIPAEDAASLLAMLGLDEDRLVRQHAELQQQLAEIDTKKSYLESLREQLDSLRSEVEQQQAKLHEEHLDLDTRRTELEKQHDELAVYRQQLDQRTDELHQLQSMLQAEQAEHEVRQQTAEQEAVESRAKLVASHDELQQARYDLETERDQWEQLKTELDETRRQWERRQAEEERLLNEKAAEFEQRQAQLNEAQEQLQSDGAAFEAKQQELLEAQQAFQQQLAQQQEMAKQQELAQQQLLAEQQQQLQSAREELLAQKTECEAQHQTWEAERQELRTVQADLSREQQEFEARKQNLEAQFQEIQAQREALESQNAELNSIRSELHRQRDELIEERARMEQARKTATASELSSEPQAAGDPPEGNAATANSYADVLPTDVVEEVLPEHSEDEAEAVFETARPSDRDVGYEQDATFAAQDAPAVDHGKPAVDSTHDLSDNLTVIEQLRAMALAADESGESCDADMKHQATWNATTGQSVPAPASPQHDNETVPAPQYASADPAGLIDANSETADDAESIDAYMARLLNRVSGSPSNAFQNDDAAPTATSPAMSAENAAPQRDGLTADDAAARHDAEADAAQAETVDPHLAPRRNAPEQTVDIAAMRELANMSADNAISASTQSRNSSAASGKVIVGAVAMVMGLVMFLLAKSVASIGFLAGLVAIAAAWLWWFQAFVLWRRSRQRQTEGTRSMISTDYSTDDQPASDPNLHGDEIAATSQPQDSFLEDDESEDGEEWIEVPTLA